MKLLIKRDATKLVPTKGKAEVEGDVPEWMKTVHSVDLSTREVLPRREDDLFIANAEDYAEIDRHLNSEINGSVPAIWSGYRSVLVSDGKGGFYKLKGVALDPKKPECRDLDGGTFMVYGAQYGDAEPYSAQYEKQTSDRFNAILREEGIEPVMEHKGFWHYPRRARGHKLSASVVKVQGDTRLDEFMFLVENYALYFQGIPPGPINVEPRNLTLVNNLIQKLNSFDGNRQFSEFYYSLGMAVGGLKRLMDEHNQTWSSSDESTNAHLGNVVLYNGTDKVKVGLVDFDTSCDAKNFSLSQIRELQRREYEDLMSGAMKGPISLREVDVKYIRNKTIPIILINLRKKFQEGLADGYGLDRAFTGVNNEIDLSRFTELVEHLRLPDLIQSFAVPVSPLPRRVCIEDEYYREERINDVYGILGKHNRYQRGFHDSTNHHKNSLEECLIK